ncbi:acetyl-CoA synthetase-like protein [Aspergillus steynii IBT 23096]|uniref:Acetyl-CoA synthetase-like protein n=1 Tax=Aspergillus steynii IBT 23096 TaxID=1392250 RepID=A0A2I2G5M9_9EURO|nr:acetyl-CoA synthetase-like protein [Aspergillus steynii IBT 23096]PLB48174.1 acetyl-CoA synthetase-like protein [Aspergillus steynii IBT 23096]
MTISTKTSQATLPDEPLFRRMLENATERPSHLLISDKSVGVEADSATIFSDLLHMLNTIRQHENTAHSFISVLMPVNYEFIITVLAVLASGQAFAPIRFGHTAEYALGLMKRCRSTCLVYGALEESFAIDIQHLASVQGYPIQIVPFGRATNPCLNFEDLHLSLDTDITLNPDRPAMLVYSSGTTGEKPKGILHKRSFFDRPGRINPHSIFLMMADPLQTISSINILALTVSTGCQLRYISRTDGVPEIWEQFRTGRICSFTAIPDTWNEMAWYYRNRIHNLPQETRDSYLEGARKVMFPYTQGASTPASVLRFWKEELQRPVYNVFGATELGGLALCTGPDTVSDDYECIGKPKSHITVKLSEGDHGELLIKSPTVILLFPHSYLNDPQRTKSVFDEEGFYHTGDLVHLSPEGEYIYERRITLKDPVSVMEQNLSALPYLQDIRVTQLPLDHAYGSFILGLVVRICPQTMKSKTTTQMDRAGCWRRLQAVFSLTFLQLENMVPIAVRVLAPDEKMTWDREQLRDAFPYNVDPTFRADYEIGVHRAWLN